MDQAKFVFYTKFKGVNLSSPEPLFKSIQDVAITRFEKRVELNILEGKFKVDEPLFLTLVAKTTLINQVQSHKQIVESIIEEKWNSTNENNDQIISKKTQKPSFKMELAPTQLNQNVSRSLLGYDGNMMAIIEVLKQDQSKVVKSLGDL